MSYIGQSPTTAAFVTDQFSGDGSTVAFTMSLAPATTSSILVSITGVLQDPSTYSVSGTTLTFSAAPPSGTGNISCRYLGIPASGVTTTAYRTVTEFTATAGQTSFSVPSYTVGYIDVYRNGVRLNSDDYTASTGTTVVLTDACSSGDSVTTESFYVSSVLNAIPATAGAVNSTYIAAGAVGQTALASGVAGNGPAFSAYQSSAQTLSSNTWTKIQLQTEEFDTAGCFDSTTNYRFTPNVAGYYQFNFCLTISTSATQILLGFYKNGSNFKNTNYGVGSGGNSGFGSALIYLNGTTDYVEMYGYIQTSQALQNGQPWTWFQASLVRAA